MTNEKRVPGSLNVAGIVVSIVLAVIMIIHQYKIRKKEQDQSSGEDQGEEPSEMAQMTIPYYSAVAVVQEDEHWQQSVDELLKMYSQGTKITAALANVKIQQYVCDRLRKMYQGKAISWKPDKKEDLRLAGEVPEIECGRNGRESLSFRHF